MAGSHRSCPQTESTLSDAAQAPDVWSLALRVLPALTCLGPCTPCPLTPASNPAPVGGSKGWQGRVAHCPEAWAVSLLPPGGASAHPGVCKRGACAVQEQSGTSGARHMGTGTVAVPWGCRERPGCPALKNGQPCRATLGPRGGLGVWAAGHSWGPSASRSSGVCACMCVCAHACACVRVC